MPFSLFNNRRKRLLEAPFPDAWEAHIRENALFFAQLNWEEQRKLRDIVRVIVGEKNWEGCQGFEMTDEVRVTISALAGLLLLGIDHDYFGNVESILVYPSGYVATERVAKPGMVVTELPSGRLGEAWTRGPVILSWPDAVAGGRNASDGRNVVLHEFAHKLDFRDGSGDGVPHLATQQQYDRWSQVMSSEFDALRMHSAHGEATLLNQYGATNPAEFFAVTTECFFEKPRPLLHAHPDLYAVFRDFYGQDPAAR